MKSGFFHFWPAAVPHGDAKLAGMRWRRLILILLLALCVPGQSFASAICTVHHASSVPSMDGMTHAATAPRASHAAPSLHLHCIVCCCTGAMLADNSSALPVLASPRQVIAIPPRIGNPVFLTDGIERPPRSLFV